MQRRIALSRNFFIKNAPFLGTIIIYLFFWTVDTTRFPLGVLSDGAIYSALRWVAIALVFCLAIVDLILKRNPRGFLFIIFLCALLTPSVISSTDTNTSIFDYARVVSSIFLYWIVKNRISESESVYNSLGLFCIGFTFLSILTFGGHVSLIPHAGDDVDGRVRNLGISYHPNILGVVGDLAFAFALSMLYKISNFRIFSLVIPFAIAGGGIYCVLASDSRTCLISLLLIICLHLAAQFFVIRKTRGRKNVILVAVVLAGISTAVLSVPLAMTVKDGASASPPTGDSYQQSNEARKDIWRNSLEEFRSHLLTGVGLGVVVVESEDPQTGKTTTAPYSHNAVLNSLYMAGVGGFVFLLIIVFAACYNLVNAIRERFAAGISISRDSYLLFFISSLISILVSATIDGSLQTNSGLNAFFAIAVGALSPTRAKLSVSTETPSSVDNERQSANHRPSAQSRRTRESPAPSSRRAR